MKTSSHRVVPWSHHPVEIKEKLRSMRLHPRSKECWKNSQIFAMESGLAVTYVEGWVTWEVPFEHGWLVYRGQVLDLTLNSAEVQYGPHIEVTREQIFANIIATRRYDKVSSRWLQQQSFDYVHRWMERLNGSRAARDGVPMSHGGQP